LEHDYPEVILILRSNYTQCLNNLLQASFST
jgi:hypothetical protein